MNHFGIELREGRMGLEISRENYAIINKHNSFLERFPNLVKIHAYEDAEGKYYTDEWCNSHREQCLQNYDLNMQFFSSLDHEDFENSLRKVFRVYKRAKEIFDLNTVDNITGCYIMVLDKYCQAYIGGSANIKRRIRQHWSNSKQFDRLLFPMGAVETSVLAIDCFRALDTTRIFVYETPEWSDVEKRMVKKMPPDFLLNRIAGGKPSAGILGFMQTFPTIKKRNLVSTE